ncbi:Elongation factor P--(R)-beta-lysine ligase [Thalassoglobus polymorphus]|uniref:Elongation factor P--(R)-beta-lysine ligase n=2 Tax=Thalassoglobus polymorphus TaxID=2527994 RepID=A0A517QP51_9PLAN|nr:Elongation factor P--(R)-beta-lysine ligase [Thalassoglobus polymorphus]
MMSESCIDRWLDPFGLQVFGKTCFLQTSPEFAMKRMLAAGADSIFQICKAFRAGEVGDHHNPEFTMLEWYRQSTPLSEQIKFVEKLVQGSLDFASEKKWIAPSQRFPQFQTLTYEAAFQNSLGISPHESSSETLQELAVANGFQLASGETVDRDDLLNYLLATVVEPDLEEMEAVSLIDYPASQSALAKIVQRGEYFVAERFEMYLHGHEICNGYQELTDPVELRRRMSLQNKKRIADGKSELPVESKLLEAMERQGLPESSGVALGFDRLVMICLGCSSLKDVLAFPFSEV